MKRRVVLYNPRVGFYTMPLALVAVGSHLDPDRYEAVVVDARLEADPLDALLGAAEGAACVGVTVLTGAPIHDAVRASRAVKARYPDLPVVWGGWHPSMFGAECLDEPSVDVTVQAQGEVTFHEVLDRLTSGESLEGCPGCTYRAPDGTIVANPPRPLADVNAFRPHDYGLLDVPRSKARSSSTTSPRRGAGSAAHSAPTPSCTSAAGWGSIRPAWVPRSRGCGAATGSSTSTSRTRRSSRRPTGRCRSRRS